MDFQLPVPQNIWLSAWCLVLPMSSDPKSAWRTRCEIQCLSFLYIYVFVYLSPGGPSVFFFFFFWFHTLFFFFLCAVITRPPSLSGELNASILSVCLSPISLFLSVVLVLNRLVARQRV